MKPELLTQLLSDVEQKRTVVLCTDLQSGAARLVHPYAPEAGLEQELLEACRQAAALDRSQRWERPGGALFLRVFHPPVRLVIVGAVHIAQSLGRMAQLAGYDVLVVDPRRAFATEQRFLGIPLSSEWPDEAFRRIGLDRRTAVVTMTHDPKIDDPALAAALRSDAFYVGALGSKKTQEARRERLRRQGFPEVEVGRICGPVGLPIGAVSPGEMAISILSQLVEKLRQPAGSRPA